VQPMLPVTDENFYVPAEFIEFENHSIKELSFYLYDHLGNTRMTYRILPTSDATFTVEEMMDYDPYGKILRHYSTGGEKYLTTQHQRDTETGLDYRGARFYDCDVARFLSVDPLAVKYPSMSGYMYVGGMAVVAVDADGRDIIILSAPNSVGGLGHAAVLIGNEISGYFLYSKNGTYSSKGASGPSNKHPEIGMHFDSLQDFANSSSNFDSDGNIQYLEAFRLYSTEVQDAHMRLAAQETVESWYRVVGSSCIDVCSNSLIAGGFDPGTESYVDGRGVSHRSISPIPNVRFKHIVTNNQDELGLNVSVSGLIRPTAETQLMYQLEADDRAKKDGERKEELYQRAINRAERFNSTNPKF
jgi:RHS repeat-associated protein